MKRTVQQTAVVVLTIVTFGWGSHARAQDGGSKDQGYIFTTYCFEPPQLGKDNTLILLPRENRPECLQGRTLSGDAAPVAYSTKVTQAKTDQTSALDATKADILTAIKSQVMEISVKSDQVAALADISRRLDELLQRVDKLDKQINPPAPAAPKPNN